MIVSEHEECAACMLTRKHGVAANGVMSRNETLVHGETDRVGSHTKTGRVSTGGGPRVRLVGLMAVNGLTDSDGFARAVANFLDLVSPNVVCLLYTSPSPRDS